MTMTSTGATLGFEFQPESILYGGDERRHIRLLKRRRVGTKRPEYSELGQGNPARCHTDRSDWSGR